MLLELPAQSNCSIAGRKPPVNHNPNSKSKVLQGSSKVWEQNLQRLPSVYAARFNHTPIAYFVSGF